jgi:hypothetical protein
MFKYIPKEAFQAKIDVSILFRTGDCGRINATGAAGILLCMSRNHLDRVDPGSLSDCVKCMVDSCTELKRVHEGLSQVQITDLEPDSISGPGVVEKVLTENTSDGTV